MEKLKIKVFTTGSEDITKWKEKLSKWVEFDVEKVDRPNWIDYKDYRIPDYLWMINLTQNLYSRQGHDVDGVIFRLDKWQNGPNRILGVHLGFTLNSYNLMMVKERRGDEDTAAHEIKHMLDDLMLITGKKAEDIIGVSDFDNAIVHDKEHWYDFNYELSELWPYVNQAIIQRRLWQDLSILRKIILKFKKTMEQSTPDTPRIIKRHVGEYWNNNKPKAIVWHTLRGNLWGSISWLAKIKLSYNYIIAKDGTIYEQVPPEKGAFHAGIYRNPNQKAIDLFGWQNPNRQSIGIAFERNGESRLTNQQVLSARFLRDKLDLPHEIAHVDISSNKPQEVLKYMQQI